MADMSVDLVAVERLLWSGRASFVAAQTTEGEIGILAGHEPLLGQLVEAGTVTIVADSGERIVAAVHGGFFSVTGTSVRVLAESADFAADIDEAAAKAVLADEAASAGAKTKAEGQLRALQKAAEA
ncbi:F0F1 ATP synthase subunit epsilon [Nocardia huaxiensis]|uniref:ATP synthase epsilon chain n=1 Tax=Nocardia huaxiensis TaxID=2755382 RepID=A0A7D6ZPE7_9NOCA|nr:F0F1 ATP synthase subunit epsilon [Nocardia huaxiensis]QLY32143.1 F0F1 ATP synthase subunit epsilon [Nocardia huaxiensis]UFS95725.1 F0F1 ATP synthase subunit epsilon [Nocardia huaxiensis]